MGAAGAVEEVEVRVDGLAVAREADRHLALHAVEEERLVAPQAHRAPHGLARPGRHEDLRLDARDAHVGGLRHRRRQDARLDEEHVGVEPGPFMAGPHEVDDAVEAHLAAVGQRGHDLDHVVELEVLAGVHRHPELERHRVLRAEDTSDRCGCGHAVTSL